MEAYGQVKGRKYPSDHMFVRKKRQGEPTETVEKSDGVKDSSTRVCDTCGEELPLVRFFWEDGKPSSTCNKCFNEQKGGRK